MLPLPQILPYVDPEEPAIRGLAAAGYGHLSMAALPWHLKQGGSEGNCECVKSSTSRRVIAFEEEVHASAPMRLFAKRQIPRAAWRSYLYRLYGTKAVREWKVGWKLVRHEVLTGRPVLMAERWRRGAPVENFLVTERIRADRPLLEQLKIVHETGGDPMGLMGPLAGFLHELHRIRFYHDDLSSEHIWVHVGESPRFGLIDLDQCRFMRLSRGRVLMNLFQVLRSIPRELLTAAQREAFLAQFFGSRWPAERASATRGLLTIAERKGSTKVLG